MSIELQLIDCNCNDCGHMVRDQIRLNKHKESYKGTGLMDNLNFGNCKKFNKPVSFIPVTCQLETQECFEHRIGFPNFKKFTIYDETPSIAGSSTEVIINPNK